jgi:UPF0755 protein
MSLFSKDFYKFLFSHPLMKAFWGDVSKFLENAQQAWRRKIKSQPIGWYLRWIVFLFFLVIIVCTTAVLLQVADRNDKSCYDFEIFPGQPAKTVVLELKNQHLVPNNAAIDLAIYAFGLGRCVKAGHYQLSPSMTVAEVIFKITSGAGQGEKTVRLMIPEGASIYKTGELLKSVKVKCATDFQRLVDLPIAPELIKKYPFLRSVKTNSLEGYLFPDTYFIRTDISADELADLMLGRFNELVIPFWTEMRGRTNLSLHEIITLASIIEKEAAYNFERPVIASVFYNRLRRGMGLAADPTIKYALENPGKKVSLKDLRVNSPYNTYKYRGLPPGPICNPGYYSIKAAILPDKTDYYFFVAQPDGTHVFSRTWGEHIKARQQSK